MNLSIPEHWSELSQAQKGKVNQYIATLLATQPALPLVQKANREVIDRREGKGVSYQLELIKCGKKGCRCQNGQLHGPYWYAYYRQGGRVHCAYLGKKWRPFNPLNPEIQPVTLTA